jgi:hypothetical protein
MAKYLLAFHGGGGMAPTPEGQAKIMAEWGAWFGQLGPALVDGGLPISQTRTIANDGAVRDGGGANPVSGYTFIEADSIDSAVKLAKGCPVLKTGGSIEVAETLPTMAM